MLKSAALVTSLLANAVLAAWLAAEAPPAQVEAGLPLPAPSSALGVRVEPEDPAGSYRRLRAAGLGEHEAKALLLAELETSAVAAVERPEDRYWEARRNVHVDYALAVAAAHADVRRRLEEVFGADAESAPEFARVYRPLEVQFPFLTPEQQLALHAWRLERQRGRVPQAAALASDGRRRGTESPDDELSGLRGVLPATAALEVALRDSMLAEDLRAAAVVFSEDEYRAAYALLADLEAARGDTRVQLAKRRELRRLLGPQRYEQIWSRRDPMMAVLRRVGAELALGDGALAAAYGVLNDTQEALLELALDAQPAERSAAEAQRIAAAESERLAGLLGEEGARTLLAARAEYFFAATRAGTRAPPAGSR